MQKQKTLSLGTSSKKIGEKKKIHHSFTKFRDPYLTEILSDPFLPVSNYQFLKTVYCSLIMCCFQFPENSLTFHLFSPCSQTISRPTGDIPNDYTTWSSLITLFHLTLTSNEIYVISCQKTMMMKTCALVCEFPNLRNCRLPSFQWPCWSADRSPTRSDRRMISAELWISPKWPRDMFQSVSKRTRGKNFFSVFFGVFFCVIQSKKVKNYSNLGKLWKINFFPIHRDVEKNVWNSFSVSFWILYFSRKLWRVLWDLPRPRLDRRNLLWMRRSHRAAPHGGVLCGEDQEQGLSAALQTDDWWYRSRELHVSSGDKVIWWLQAVIEDTDQNPTGVCQKVIHKTCPYNN